MKKYLFFAAALVALASCSDDNFVGDNSPNQGGEDASGGAIVFASSSKGVTRGDIHGASAADLLGNHFYVTGTKGTEDTDNPTENVVFNNYFVSYEVNSAGKTESNTANWEYVGVTPDGTNYSKLSPDAVTNQTIKYWDYSTAQYDFLAFSTGTYDALKVPDPYVAPSETNKEIWVTAMKYGSNLANSAVAYTFDVPSVEALKNAFITDITEVAKASYGKEVQLKFKNLGSKVRVGLYETVPGYSVQAGSVRFYTVDGTTSFTDAKGEPAALISENANSFATKGKINVYFPNVGTSNHGNDNYNKAAATIADPGAGDTKKTFGNLSNKAAAEVSETSGNLYLGRTLPTATFAGDENASYYTTVFPVSTGYPLTLRVDYTLIATDGQGETINVKGAKAVVPSTYTKWQPNYAYTYIFKISDNTNGWTGTGSENAGLYPITFDAVVAEATDAQGEQTTITTVATPSITTYQQGNTYATNEYDNDGEKLYVQVMDNNLTPAKLVGTATSKLPLLNAAKDDETPKYHASLLYAVSNVNATEAMVMDALEKRTATIGNYDTNVTGRNGITLTYNSNINNAVTNIVNGVDDNKITVTAGQAAEIAIGSLTAGTYAYVYDYSWESTTSYAWTTSTFYTGKSEVQVYQPITTSTTSPIGANGKYYIAVSSLTTWDAGIATQSAHYTSSENAAAGYLYFSITTNGGATKTYSFVSVDGKIGEALPNGLLKVPANQLTAVADNTANASADTFYFDTYFSNNGKYAVKVIKVVD